MVRHAPNIEWQYRAVERIERLLYDGDPSAG